MAVDHDKIIWAISEDGDRQNFTQAVWDMMPEHKYRFKLCEDVPESVKAEMQKQKAAKEPEQEPAVVDPAAAALAKAKAAKEQ